MFGYESCKRCGAAVLDVIAWKTDGHCAPCFRVHAAEIIDPVMVIVAGREKLILQAKRNRRSPGERAQRKRAKQARKADPDHRARTKAVAACHTKALRRLRHLMPELYEILLADERAAAGLDAWTIDRALTPHDASSSLTFLESYYGLHREVDT